jgi:hypothetical protein
MVAEAGAPELGHNGATCMRKQQKSEGVCHLSPREGGTMKRVLEPVMEPRKLRDHGA